MEYKIPKPIMFNPYKHHYYFINEQIELWKKEHAKDIKSNLIKLGDNLLDLYHGKLSVREICDECITLVNNQNVFNKEDFVYWLKPKGYKTIQLSDQSVWILKEGETRERYIHIHPAKNSVCTIRVRATTLKTIIGLKIKFGKNNQPTLKAVNYTRINYLGLSPVKKLEEGKGIMRLWHLFKQK